MAIFVHITDARRLATIRRNGLRAERGYDGGRYVFCVPMTDNYQVSFQWARELRRRGYRQSCAVLLRIEDGTPVLIGPYAGPFETRTAAEAVQAFRLSADPGGLEVRLPRSVSASEIFKVVPVQRATGWRYYPGAKGARPLWPAPGEVNARKLRRSLNAWYDGYDT